MNWDWAFHVFAFQYVNVTKRERGLKTQCFAYVCNCAIYEELKHLTEHVISPQNQKKEIWNYILHDNSASFLNVKGIGYMLNWSKRNFKNVMIVYCTFVQLLVPKCICSFLRNLIMCSLSNWSAVVYMIVKVVYSGAFERCIVVRVHVMNPEWDVASESSLVKLGTTLKGQNTLHALNDDNGNNANKTWGIIYWVLH